MFFLFLHRKRVVGTHGIALQFLQGNMLWVLMELPCNFLGETWLLMELPAIYPGKHVVGTHGIALQFLQANMLWVLIGIACSFSRETCCGYS